MIGVTKRQRYIERTTVTAPLLPGAKVVLMISPSSSSSSGIDTVSKLGKVCTWNSTLLQSMTLYSTSQGSLRKVGLGCSGQRICQVRDFRGPTLVGPPLASHQRTT